MAPVVVAADADFAAMVPLLVKGGFYHAGQVCVSVQRVFAVRQIAEKLADAIAQQAGALTVGDPVLPQTQVGPLIRPSEVERVGKWVAEAVGGGAKLCCGGRPLGPTCYAPTVLYNPPADSRVMTHEVFGPVVCVVPCDELDEAIARANASPTPSRRQSSPATWTRPCGRPGGWTPPPSWSTTTPPSASIGCPLPACGNRAWASAAFRIP